MGDGAPAIYRLAWTRSVDPTPWENISGSRWLAAGHGVGPRGSLVSLAQVHVDVVH